MLSAVKSTQILTPDIFDPDTNQIYRKALIEKMAWNLRVENEKKDSPTSFSKTWQQICGGFYYRQCKNLTDNIKLIFFKNVINRKNLSYIIPVAYPLISFGVACGFAFGIRYLEETTQPYIEPYLNKEMQIGISAMIFGGLAANFQARMALSKMHFFDPLNYSKNKSQVSREAVTFGSFSSFWISKDIFWETRSLLSTEVFAFVMFCALYKVSKNMCRGLSLHERKIRKLTLMGISVACMQVLFFSTMRTIYSYYTLPKIDRIYYKEVSLL